MKTCVRFFVVLNILTLVFGIFAEEGLGHVYEVSATVLMVRAEPNAKAQVVLKLPRGSFVLNFDDAKQNQTQETIGGKKGRWLRVQGYAGYDIGYVFEGFLKRRTDLGYNDISESCKVLPKVVDCGEDKFPYNATVPVVGSWYSQPGTEHGGLAYVNSKNTKNLKRMLESPNPKANWPAGANATMILDGNKVLQFVVVPTPRGFGG